jgi:polysaccharide chain length determinant protein (PEP-CTERM system associated)
MNATPRTPEMDEAMQKGVSLQRFRAVWSRRKWLGILVFAVPFAAATGAILSLPSLYRSTATVLVERQQVPEAFVRPTVTSELETRLQTISQEILSRSRLEGLISRFGLYADLRKHESNEEILERMRRDIRLDIRSADPRGRQSVTVAFALSYRGRDPQTVALVTNTLASFYIEENLKARERQASGTTEFLKVQLTGTAKRLDEQERQVSEFKRRYLAEMPQQMQSNLASLEAFNTQLRLNSDNQVRVAERQEALAAQLVEADSLGQALVAPGAPAPGPEPPAVHLTRLKQDLTTAQTRYTDAHPTVIRLKEEIAVVERALTTKEPEAKAEAAPAPAAPRSQYALRLREALRVAEAEMKILKADDQRLRGAIAAYQVRVENAPRREQEFQDISRDYESTKELHRSLVKRYEEAQLAESMEQRQKGEQFRVLDPAVPSAVTAAPNRQRLLLMVLVLSLGLAAGAVMLAEMVDTSFHAADELRAFTTAPVLVSIPWISTEADLRRRRLRFRLATAGAMLGLALVAGTSYAIGHGNEQLVRMLDRGAL